MRSFILAAVFLGSATAAFASTTGDATSNTLVTRNVKHSVQDSRPVRKHKLNTAAPSGGARVRRDNIEPRAATVDIVALIGKLGTLKNVMQLHQTNIKKYRHQYKTNPRVAKTGKWNHELSNEVAAYRRAYGTCLPVISQIETSFGKLGGGTGTENLDRRNQVEVTLKDLVNSIKYTMVDINYLVFKLPVLGPVLGPIVYDIKCLIDDLLNAVERSTDSILNGVAPQLTGLTSELGISLANIGGLEHLAGLSSLNGLGLDAVGKLGLRQ